MAVDRDIAVSVLDAWRRVHGGGLVGWDALAATGVRGLRLMNETAAFERIVLTELSPQGLLVLRQNAGRWPAGRARAAEHDARTPLADERFDVVDLDPFGTPVPFLRAALASLRTGGLLGVAATDMPVLAGVERGVAERRYGGHPVRGRLGPEGGLRLLLAYLARLARTMHFQIRPVVSYVHDHHVRTYVQVLDERGGEDPVATIETSTWPGPALGTDAAYGPLWLGPLFEAEFARELRLPASSAAPDLARRYIERFREEAPIPAAFYYEPNEVARRVRAAEPPAPDRLVQALREAGWTAARTHARASGVRTDAPRSEVERCVASLAHQPRSARQSQNARVRA